jgi:hypothetical protein
MQFVLLIFAVLTIVGAFAGWRSSPLYSLKTTFKPIGAFLLIVVIVIGVAQALVNVAISRSPLVQAVLGFLAIMVLACGASVFVVQITDKHVAQLPVSAKLVSFNRHQIYRWIWRLAVFLLINAAAALVLPSSWNTVPIGLAGFVLLLCGPMLSIAYMMARRNDRGMTSVIASPWAHWQYTPEKWAQWAKAQRDWEKAQEGPWTWKGVLGFVLFCVALFVLGAIFSGATLQENLLIVSMLTGFIILLTVMAYWFKSTNFDRRYRRLLLAAPEAWFGDEGLFCNGTYMPWILSGRFLLKASAASDPQPELTLTFQSFNGGSSTLITQRIPIPDGHISDLLTLQEKLRTHCPTASVHLTL